MTEVVRYEVVDRVAVITIDRPEVRNALSLDVFAQLRERAGQAAGDDAVGAVLVRGEGGNLSSGLDVSVMGELAGEVSHEFIAGLQDTFTAYEDLDKPTAALIEGYCLGGGIQLAAACHVRLVAPTAQISVLERRWGLVPDLGGTTRLPRLVGQGRATELILTARRIDADEALRIGLAEVAVGADDPYGEALAWTAALAAGPGAVRRVPRLVRENWDRPRQEALEAERATQLDCIAGPDTTEAVVAWMEKRDPSFVGR
jgi:enoyl-CoA hydratase/carnithine racemase